MSIRLAIHDAANARFRGTLLAACCLAWLPLAACLSPQPSTAGTAGAAAGDATQAADTPTDGNLSDGGAQGDSGVDAMTAQDASAQADLGTDTSAAADAASVSSGPTQAQWAYYQKLARAAQFLPCWEEDNPAKMLGKIINDMAFHWSELAVVKAIDCLATQTDGCAAWSKCAGLTMAPSGPCKPGCAGDVASACFSNKAGTPMQFSFDCAKVGWTCTTKGKGFCAPPAGNKACPSGSEGYFCDGQTVAVCHTELQPPLVEPMVNCGKLGMTCAASFPGSAGCVGSGPACDQNAFTPKCDGGKLRDCEGGKQALIDCAQLLPGGSCQTVNGEAFCGLGAECNSSWEPCEGTSARFCLFGKIMKFDCKALGFTGCHPEYGMCTPIWQFQ